MHKQIDLFKSKLLKIWELSNEMLRVIVICERDSSRCILKAATRIMNCSCTPFHCAVPLPKYTMCNDQRLRRESWPDEVHKRWSLQYRYFTSFIHALLKTFHCHSQELIAAYLFFFASSSRSHELWASYSFLSHLNIHHPDKDKLILTSGKPGHICSSLCQVNRFPISKRESAYMS